MSVTESVHPPADETSVNGSAPKLIHVFEQLRAMRAVKSNWDGYNADAPREDAIQAAEAFLKTLAQFQIGGHLLPLTNASPTRIGGVLLEWDAAPHELEVEIETPPVITGAYLNTETDEARDFTVDPKLTDSPEFFELAARTISIFASGSV